VFFCFRIEGANDGDGGVRIHDVSSKHVADLSKRVLEKRHSNVGGWRFEVGGKKRKTQRKTVDLICFNYLNSTTVI
ncbi:MAG: hypothetical protein WCB15_25905, partial [Desulfobacterales bacterium]